VRQGCVQSHVSKFILPDKAEVSFKFSQCQFDLKKDWDTPLLTPNIDSGEIQTIKGTPVVTICDISIFNLREVLYNDVGNLFPSKEAKMKAFQEYVVKVSACFKTWYQRSWKEANETAEISQSGLKNKNLYQEIAKVLLECVELYVGCFHSDSDTKLTHAPETQLHYSQFVAVLHATIVMADILFVADDSLDAVSKLFSPSIMHDESVLRRFQGFVFHRKGFMDLVDNVTSYYIKAAKSRPRQILSSEPAKERDTVLFIGTFAKSCLGEHPYHNPVKKESV
jgi:hypothetical protein